MFFAKYVGLCYTRKQRKTFERDMTPKVRDMEQVDLFYRFGAALAIGFLIRLQREYAHGGPGKEIFAGERTLGLHGSDGG